MASRASGTRITVYDVLEYLAGGMSPAEIVEDFPELAEDHVRAALEFAALRERRLATTAAMSHWSAWTLRPTARSGPTPASTTT